MGILAKDNLFVLSAAACCYAMRVDEDGQLLHLYWGAAVERAEDFIAHEAPRTRWPLACEISSFGEMRYIESGVKPRFSDGVRDFRYKVTGHSVEGDLLSIELQDERYPLKITLFYRMHESHGVIERWQRAENLGRDEILLERFHSAQFNLPGGGYSSINYRGQWAAEFRAHNEKLEAGKKVYESLRGIAGFLENPSFILHRDACETSGEVYFGALAYSGSFKIVAESVPDLYTQVLVGVSDSDFEWPLGAGEAFEAPHVFAGYSDQGFGGMSNRMARFAREALLPKSFAKKPLPVLYNSWMATEFAVNAKHQMALAERAAGLGVELFVVDDGWFGERHSDRAGLGDWQVNHAKFPNGLNELIERVHTLGMKFGIWIEPEMVNPDSELYRAHPGWILRDPTREPLKSRNQYMLDFSNPVVVDHMLGQIDALLRDHPIDYIKWDYNRAMGECANLGGKPESFKQIWVRIIRGFYRMAETLRQRHPSVEFEACAAGGGRVDYGCLQRFDEFWPTDNTDAMDRLLMQQHYSYLYPVKCMRAWVTFEGGYPLRFRAHASMCGALGIGLNLTECADEELSELAGYVAEYKRIRDAVQFGELFRLTSIEAGEPIQAVQYVKGGKAVLFAFLPHAPYYRDHYQVRLRGLNEKALYQFELDGRADCFSGAYLMNVGLCLRLRNNFDSRMIVLEAARY